MRIYAEQLRENLEKHLKSVYLLLGQEPLFIEESKSAIRQTMAAHGFESCHRYPIDASTDWIQIFDHFQALSLFASRQIVELTLPESLTKNVTDQLVELSQYLHPDTCLVIVAGKLTKAQEKAKWFQSLAQQACIVSCLTPDLKRLPQIVNTRCNKLGLTLDEETLHMLVQWHEGNLLALSQSLEKLALLYPDGQLTLVRIEQALSRHNHFTVYHWIDALLAGKAKRSQRILRQLKAEGIEMVILVRAIQKELMLLFELKSQLDIKTQPSHQRIQALMDQKRIWQNKRPFYMNALQRLDLNNIRDLLQQLTQIESLTKTQFEQSPWPQLQMLSLHFTQPTFPLPSRG